MTERTILLLGAGRDRRKKLYLNDPEWNGKVIAIDMHPSADLVFDMNLVTLGKQLPYEDNSIDEIHAYDSLEHWGTQGDWRAWFTEMGEYHRVLKPGGQLVAVVPIGEDRFADPGHTRFIGMNHFLFLSQAWYAEQERLGTSAADYRWYWKKDFEPLHASPFGEPHHHLGVLIRKPL